MNGDPGTRSSTLLVDVLDLAMRLLDLLARQAAVLLERLRLDQELLWA